MEGLLPLRLLLVIWCLGHACQALTSTLSLSVGEQAIITSPNFGPGRKYPRDIEYLWNINSSLSDKMTVTFHTFDLELHSLCAWDYVIVNNDTCDSGTGKRHCGAAIPEPYVTSASSVCIRFHSDAIIPKAGFNLTVSASVSTTTTTPATMSATSMTPDLPHIRCGADTPISQSAIISSPGYGVDPNYPNNVLCLWLIELQVNQIAVVTFESFHLEFHKSCVYDWLKIYDSPMVTSQVKTTFCGDTKPSNITLSKTSYIQFKSDIIVPKPGFLARILITNTMTSSSNVQSSSSSTQSTPAHSSTSSTESTLSTLKIPSTVQATTATTVSSSTATLTSAGTPTTSSVEMCKDVSVVEGVNSMTLLSPGYNEDQYPLNTSCDLTLTTDTDKKLLMSFPEFLLEFHPICIWDSLSLYDGTCNSGSLMGKYCGSSNPTNQTTLGNKLCLKFKSDIVVPKKGFKIVITTKKTVLADSNHNNTTTAITGSHVHESHTTSGEVPAPNPQTSDSSSSGSTSPDVPHPSTPSSTTDLYTFTEGPSSPSSPSSSSSSSSPSTQTVSSSVSFSSSTGDTATSSSSSEGTYGISFDGSTESSPSDVSSTETTLSASPSSTSETPEVPICSSSVMDVYSPVTVTSPNLGSGLPYPPDTTCTLCLSCPLAEKLHLSFTEFDVEPHNTCAWDSLTVYDGNSTTAPTLATLCGDLYAADSFTSSTRSLCLKFVSDFIVQKRGFKATVKPFEVTGRLASSSLPTSHKAYSTSRSTAASSPTSSSTLSSTTRSSTSLKITSDFSVDDSTPHTVATTTTTEITTTTATTTTIPTTTTTILTTTITLTTNTTTPTTTTTHITTATTLTTTTTIPTTILTRNTTTPTTSTTTPTTTTTHITTATTPTTTTTTTLTTTTTTPTTTTTIPTTSTTTPTTTTTTPTTTTTHITTTTTTTLTTTTTTPTTTTTTSTTTTTTPTTTTITPTNTPTTTTTTSTTTTTTPTTTTITPTNTPTTTTITPTTTAATTPTTTTTTSSVHHATCTTHVQVLTSSSGILSSPGFESQIGYPNNLDCKWLINAEPHHAIHIAFTSFELESHSKCSWDSLTIYNGSDVTDDVIAKLCGAELPGNITTNGRPVLLHFHSDRVITKTGFRLIYYTEAMSSKPGESTDAHFTCSDGTSISVYQRCDGNPDCSDVEDEDNCTMVDSTNDEDMLFIMRNGSLFPVCFDQWEAEVSDQACEEAGYGNVIQQRGKPSPATTFLIPTGDGPGLFHSKFIFSSACASGRAVSLTCQPRECGRKSNNLPTAYILGGSRSVRGEWPWVVSLMSGRKQVCGAAIISSMWVITAGHCVENLINSPQTTNIVAGHVNLDAPNVESFRVTELILHPEYNFIYNADIALIRLQRPLVFSARVKPLCLPSSQRHWPTSLPCFIAGWGVTKKMNSADLSAIYHLDILAGVTSPYLHHAKLHLWSQNKCREVYHTKVKDTMICAGEASGSVDACKGDSGSPLMCQTAPDKWVQVGITSWGEGCGQVGKPGVYTRVDRYIDWIKQQTKQMEAASCSFESPGMCGYMDNSTKDLIWTRRKGGVAYPQRPYNDNTFGNTSGHYMYAFVSYESKNQVASLTSPTFSNPGYSCLTFSVTLMNAKDAKLRVYGISNSSGDSTIMMQLAPLPGAWRMAEQQLDGDVSRVVFVAQAGRWTNGGVGLDDVKLQSGRCEGTLKVACDFDGGTLCEYLQAEDNPFNWNLKNRASTGHNSDHYLEADGTAQNPGDMTRVFSPVLNTTVPQCIRFQFKINPPISGTLSVCTKSVFQDNVFLNCNIWSRASSKGNDWTEGQAQIPAFTYPYSIVFQAERGMMAGVVAIDNLDKTDGDCNI